MRYLANLLTAGKEEPVLLALERMLAMRAYKRSETVHGERDSELLAGRPGRRHRAGHVPHHGHRRLGPLRGAGSHKEMVEDSFNEKGSCGFTFGNGCSGGVSEGSLFGKKPQGSEIFIDMPKSRRRPPRPEQRRTR